MAERIVIDPITRIEGNLRVEIEVNNGKITDAYNAGTMVRGIETILKGRDPRDAWVFVGRVCGVCTSTQSLTSVRIAENALGIQVPPNTELIRDLGKIHEVKAEDPEQIQEFVDNSWYEYSKGKGVGLPSWEGETKFNYTGPTPPYEELDVSKQYGWRPSSSAAGRWNFPSSSWPISKTAIPVRRTTPNGIRNPGRRRRRASAWWRPPAAPFPISS